MSLNKRKNRYFKRTHISERKFREILKEFCYDSTGTETAKRTGISRVTVTKIFHLLRLRMKELALIEGAEVFADETEIDESYFGPKRVRGKRGRGAGFKVPVFGLLKRGGKVFTRVVRNCSKAELWPIIKGKVLTGSILYSDGWKAYDGLVYNYDHYRIHHSKDEFARGRNHINGIESFWSWSKKRMAKFNGIKKDNFELFLKECEFRFNHRDDLQKVLLKSLRNEPLINL